MRKIFTSLALFTLVGLFIFAGYCWIERVDLVSHFLSRKLQVDVEIGGIEIRGKNTLEITNLKIANPKGARLPHAATIDRIQLVASPLSALGKKIHVLLFELKGAYFSVELYNLTGSDNNWSRLLSAVMKKEREVKSPSPDEKKSSQNKASSKEWQVDALVFDSIQCDILSEGLLGGEHKEVSISRIELKNLGSDQALTTQQVFQTVAQAVLSHLSHVNGLSHILQGLPALPFKIADRLLSSPEKIEGDASQLLRKGTKSVEKALRSFFPQKQEKE